MSSLGTLPPRAGVAEHSWGSTRELQSKASSLEFPPLCPSSHPLLQGQGSWGMRAPAPVSH